MVKHANQNLRRFVICYLINTPLLLSLCYQYSSPFRPQHFRFLSFRQKWESFIFTGKGKEKFIAWECHTGKRHWVIYRRRENSSNTGGKGIIYAHGNLGGTKIGLRIVTRILLREIKSHKIRCRRWNCFNALSRQFWRRMCKNGC